MRRGIELGKALVVLAVTILVVVPVFAGGSSEGTGAASDRLGIAMVLPGPVNDGGYNSGGKAGLDALGSRFDARTSFADSVAPTDFVEVFRDFAGQGYDFVIGHGNQFNDAAMLVRTEFPNTTFIVNGGQDWPGGNYLSVGYHEAHAGFVPGYIAGRMTQTNRAAGIGGFDFPGIVAQLEGFRQGFEYANPDGQVGITYIGTMDNVATAKEAALAQIDAGADVVFQIVNQAGPGVFEAARERNVYAVGFASDQSRFAPDHVITSLTIDFGRLYGAAIELVLSGATIEQKIYRFGYETDPPPIGHAGTHLIPPDILADVDAVKQRLGSGEIQTELIFTRQ